MDRATVYPQELASDTDILNIGKFAMVGLGWLIQAVLGTSVAVDGLACTPGGGLTVSVAAGAIYAQTSTDATAYGSLGTDTHQLMKQGLSLDPVVLNTPAPGTSGQSINYLVEVAYADTDAGSTVLSYYNAANPSVPYSGPGGGGGSNTTLRKGVCTVQVKAGTPATTGSQTTPSPDSGFTGLYVVTVAFGASSVTTGNISQLSTAPFIRTKLPAIAAAIQNNSYTYAVDSGSANAMVAAVSPAPASLTAGLTVLVKAAANNTGATTLNLNGLGAVSVKVGGANLTTGMIQANQLYELAYDGSAWELVSPASNGAAQSGDIKMFAGTSAPSGWLMCDGSAVSRTTYAALFAAASTAFGAGDGSTTFNLPDFRGVFPRGFDSAGSTDPSRTYGSRQGHAQQLHNHGSGIGLVANTVAWYGDTNTDIVINGHQVGTQSSNAVTQGYTSTGSPAASGGTGSPAGTFASETRPVNLAVTFIIKI